MGILIDLFLIAIILLNIFIGYKKGLIGAIVNICAFFIAIVLSLILYKPISNIIINNTKIDDNIKELIIKNNSDNENKDTENNEDETFIEKYISNKIKETTEEAKDQTIEAIGDAIAIKTVQILTVIVVFIIVRIIIILLKFFTESISEIPIIKQFNQVGGILYGLIKAIVIIYLLLTILFLVVSINGNGKISKTIEESYVTKFLYENNVIVNYCLLDKNLL